MTRETKGPEDDRRRRVNRISAARFVAVGASLLVAGCVVRQPGLEAMRKADADASAQQTVRFNEDLTLLAAQAASAEGEYVIGPEDLIEVTLYDIQDTSGEPRLIAARVSNSGYITLPYVGKVLAQGLGPLELEERLRRDYVRFIHDPQITVFIREYRSFRVSVVGNVKTPGVLELKGRKTLLEALAMAGGLDPEAGRSVRLSRASDDQVQSVLIDLDQLTQNGDVRLNPTLVPGDVITVPRAGIFYVEGMVNKPGAYPLLAETTVSQAIVTAGGLRTELARASGTTIYRKSPSGEREAIEVDIGAITDGKFRDLPIQAEDVVVVPISGPKFFVERVTGLVRVGVNAAMF